MKDLWRLLPLIAARGRWVVLGVTLSLAALLANVGLLALSSWFIASMALAGSAGVVMDWATPAAGVRALALARAAGRYLERLVNHETTLRILCGLRVWVFERLVPLAPARLAGYRTGDLLSRIRADVDTLDDFYVRGVVPSIVAVIAGSCIVAFVARFDGRLAAIDAAALAACGVLLPAALNRLAARPGAERVAAAADLRAWVVEGVHGMAELIALGAADHHGERLAAAGRRMEDRQRTLVSLQGLGDAGIVALSGAAAWAAAALLCGSAGRLAAADAVMLIVLVLASFEAVMPLPAVAQRAGEMGAAARRLFEIIDAEPAVAEPAETAGPAAAMARRPNLSIRDLSFRYAPGLPWVLDGLSLDIACGERLAVTGPTGAGKSTLVGLLVRFWDFEQGAILVGGVEVRERRSDEIRRLFSVVPQAPFLFHASIRENLAFAREDATDDMMWSALETAQLAETVAGLPERLETVVGETGTQMSVGQARRLAAARALLKDAPFYLLDEPTEGLDDATADRLLSAVDLRLKGRTLVIISHRPRDLDAADRLVWLASPRPAHH